MNKHDTKNEECKASCDSECNQDHTHFDENDCTCPAQKEDPFSDFLKTQGINVVDVTPTQKEEWDEEFRKRWSGNVMNGPLSAVIDAIIADMHRQISLAEARGREAGMEKAREIVTNMENPYDIDSHLTFFQGWDQCNADVRLAIIQELNNYVPR